MLTRILLRLIFLAGLATPLSVLALGVGPIEVRSALNQNFEADIPLIVNNPVELTGLIIRIPHQQDFDRMGIERLELLNKLHFTIPKPGEAPIIRVTSQEPIREPNFNLLLELVWPRGRLLREFPVQLDPTLYANRRSPPPPPPPPIPAAPPPQPVAVAAQPPAPTLPTAPPVSFEGASFYGPVKSGETLRAIANRVRPSTAVNLPDMMAILVAGNQEAFRNGNPNTLRAGSVLRVPTPQALGVSVSPTPTPELATPAPAAPVAVTESATPATPATPPTPVEPSSPSPVPPVPPVPPATEPAAVAPLPTPVEPPKEIVPQASIPQPTPQPVAAAPEPAPQPVAAAPEPAPQPVAAAPEPVKPPPTPVTETEASWTDNPIVWIAIALIVLAVGAMSLLPLLQRTAKPKPAVNLGKTGSDEAGAATPLQSSQPRTKRTVAEAEPEPAAAPRPAAELATPQPTAPAMPKPINELLRDIDLDLGSEQLALSSGKGASPTPLPKPARLPDAEPPTAPISREAAPAPAPAAPVARPQAPTPAARPQAPTPANPSPSVDLPSDLRLDGMDFNFGDLEIAKPARSQPELPPLELKPATPGAKPAPVNSAPLMELGGFDPLTEPASIAGVKASPVTAAPTAPPASQKFEFSDVMQDLKNVGQEDSFRLGEELNGLGGETLNLGQMDIGGTTGGATSTDYVETKLDLAAAYLDMGDQVGARSLLEDVQREGDASQKSRAGEMLKNLS